MLNDLEVTNIQSHKSTVFNFHPGVNVITGPSDVGKSVIIRSLKNVAMNKPAGDILCRHGTKKSTILLDGVKKTKTSTKNQYVHEGVTYKALRSDVPPEITTALRLSEINFQEQHDAYFLIAESPGKVSKTLNKVADLEIIDLSLKVVRQRVSVATANKKSLKEQLIVKKEKVKDLQWVVQADRDWKKIEDLLLKEKDIQTEAISNQILLINRLEFDLEQYPIVKDDIQKVKNQIKELDIDFSVGDAIIQVEENQTKIPDVREDLKLVKQNLKGLLKDNTELDCAYYTGRKAKAKASIYPEVIDTPEDLILRMQSMDSRIETVDEALIEAFVSEDCRDEAVLVYDTGKLLHTERLKEIGVCPLCEGKL